jgi:ABC-2 type transport system permease protein
MREFWRVVAAFFVRDATHTLSYRLEFVLQLVHIVFYISGLYFLSTIIGENSDLTPYGGYLPFAAIGVAVASYFQTGFDSFAKAIQREQMHGTLESLLMMPLRLPTIIIACCGWRFVWTTLTSIVYVTAAVVLYDIKIQGSLVLAFALLLLTTLVFISLGVISASFVMVFKRGDPVGMVLGRVSTLLGGVFYPVTAMPGWLQDLAYLLPITHGLDAIRSVLLQGATLADVWPKLVVLLAFSCVLLPLGLWCFRSALSRARREGTLLHY